MRKSIGLGLLGLLVAGMVQSSAFADPPRMNGRIWHNNNYNRCDYDRDRIRDQRQAERARWQFHKQRLADQRRWLAEQRRLANQNYRDRMRYYRLANNYNNRW